jgi:hypothetical protein
MYVAITCCIMTCFISKGFVTYHGSLECEINYNYNYNYNYLVVFFRFSTPFSAKCFNVSDERTVSIFRVTEMVLLDTKVIGEKKNSVIYVR